MRVFGMENFSKNSVDLIIIERTNLAVVVKNTAASKTPIKVGVVGNVLPAGRIRPVE